MNILQVDWMGSASNCYIVYSEGTKEGVLVDPGGYPERIMKVIEDNDLNVNNIILTHGHGDHIGAVEAMKEELDARVMIHKDDVEMLGNSDLNLSEMLFRKPIELKPDRVLKDGELIEIEDLKIRVVHTPGHTEGGICLDCGDFLITGDTLFAGSVGRADLPGGDGQMLIKSIKERLLTYPADTKIYPGHQGASTIGNEKLNNQFLR